MFVIGLATNMAGKNNGRQQWHYVNFRFAICQVSISLFIILNRFTLKVVFVEHHTHFNVYVSQQSQIQFED